MLAYCYGCLALAVTKVIHRIAVFVLVLALPLLVGGAASAASGIEAAARGYTFSIVGWEMQWLGQVGPHLPPHTAEQGGDPSAIALVSEYFDLGQALRGLPADLGADDRQATAAEARARRDRLAPRVESVLRSQVRNVLRDEGIAIRLGLQTGVVFPPVQFRFADMPLILAVSPREKIELIDTVLLDPHLSGEDMDRIERAVEGHGLSAEIERIGGLAVYPSMVPSDQSLSSSLSLISHEWLHHYFAFKPLGRAYWSSDEMTTVNETAADIGGREIADLVYRRYYPAVSKPAGESQPAGGKADQGAAETDGFDFRQEMRTTRLTAEEYLRQGQVDRAEEYMEERRLFLARHGYLIRKLNQAYFAFHGTYADDPASVSPVGDQLARLRAQSGSLGAFIRQVSGISSYDQLESLSAR